MIQKLINHWSERPSCVPAESLRIRFEVEHCWPVRHYQAPSWLPLVPSSTRSKLEFIYSKKKCTSFECQCIKHESTNWGHYFYASHWRRDRHFTWSSEPRVDLAICWANMAKAVPSFLSYFKTLSIGSAPGIEPATSRCAVKRSTDWANPAGVIYLLLIIFAKRPGSLTEQAPIRGMRYSRLTGFKIF